MRTSGVSIERPTALRKRCAMPWAIREPMLYECQLVAPTFKLDACGNTVHATWPAFETWLPSAKQCNKGETIGDKCQLQVPYKAARSCKYCVFLVPPTHDCKTKNRQKIMTFFNEPWVAQKRNRTKNNGLQKAAGPSADGRRKR